MHWIAFQPLAEDAAAVPDLADAQQALGWWSLQFTPKVARLDGMWVMEVSASERLFGGRAALVQRMRQLHPPPVPVRMARGSTSLVALARLHPLGRRAASADALPLSTLAAAQPHLKTLATLGCYRWGQLRALPRGGVARRFGAALLDALDRAYGAQPESYPWLVLPDVFEARIELAARVDAAPALMFGARRLLVQLQLWLQLRQRGVLALALGWEFDGLVRDVSQAQQELLVRTAQPTQGQDHLLRLLAEHLAQVTLAAPVDALTLRSLETASIQGASNTLLQDETRQGDSLHQFIERLSARLGGQAVRRWVACSDHRPEYMQFWVPAQAAFQAQTTVTQASPLYPTWLLPQPLALDCDDEGPLYQGRLLLLAGPQRLEAGWWTTGESGAVGGHGSVLRDYYIAQNPQAQCVWIYRERLSRRDGADRWYLHGVYA
ncbi:MAG: hypothetical protein RLZZ591_2568 [Pseudomonadota bacterium]|jgi:protein ImuB